MIIKSLILRGIKSTLFIISIGPSVGLIITNKLEFDINKYKYYLSKIFNLAKNFKKEYFFYNNNTKVLTKVHPYKKILQINTNSPYWRLPNMQSKREIYLIT